VLESVIGREDTNLQVVMGTVTVCFSSFCFLFCLLVMFALVFLMQEHRDEQCPLLIVKCVALGPVAKLVAPRRGNA
jgi:hypothetical protein